MATVKIKYAPIAIMCAGFMDSAKMLAMVRAALTDGSYRNESKLFDVTGDSQDAAEEVFDLTNNPYRQEVRVQVYGRDRSLSVGDIVVVGEEQWLCCSFGWQEV